MAGIVEPGLQGRKRLSCAPVAVGDDGDGFLQADDALDARHRLGGRRVYGDQLGAKDGRDVDGRIQHPRNREVDSVDGAAVDLLANVEPLSGRASDGVGVRILQRRVRRNGKMCGGRRQLAEAGASPGRVVENARAAGLALGRVDAEARGRGRDQHFLGGGPSDRHPEDTGRANRRGASGRLNAVPSRDPVGAVVECAAEQRGHRPARERADDVGVRVRAQRGRFLHPNEIPVGLHLLGSHHGQRGPGTLTHFAVRHEDGHEIVRGDGDPGVELPRLGRAVRNHAVPAGRERHTCHAEHQPAAHDGAGADKGASCPFAHGVLL